MAHSIEMALATPIVQTAEFVPGSKIKLRVPEGDPNVFRLPDAADPELSRAYLQAAQRARPGAANIDVTVVLDGSTALFHGPPTCWEAGVAQRVLRGELRLGIIRVQRAGSPKAPRASSAQADAASSSDPTLSCPAKDAQPSATAGDEAADSDQARRRSRSERLSKSAPAGSLQKILSRPIKYGIWWDIGGCASMEDAWAVHQPLGADFAFCGIFDGHGGAHAAHFCRDNLHFNVMAASSFYSGDPRAALRDGFRKTEADLIYEQSRRGQSQDETDVSDGNGNHGGGSGCCGTTALLMLLQGEHMHVAWLGDCRAVLCRNGNAIALTTDHSLKDSDERARALADGGRVEGHRLGGFLEVARALGDFDHTQGGKPAGLSAQPSVRSEIVSQEDEFVILGSDGLWGVVQNEDAVRLARAELATYDNDAEMASQKLIEVALKRHCDDNVSVMVVNLNVGGIGERQAPRERPRLVLAKRSTGAPAVPPRDTASMSPMTASTSSLGSVSLAPSGAATERSSVSSLERSSLGSLERSSM